MGRNKRVGRDRDTGTDPLARLDRPVASQEPVVTSQESAADTGWGVTGMPSWLDTPRGRQAWTRQGFDCLDPDPLDPDPVDFDSAGEPAPAEWPETDPVDASDGDADDAIAPRAGLESLGDAAAEDWEDDWDPPRRRLTMLPPAAIGLIVVGVIACAIAGYSLLRTNEPVAPLVAFESTAGPRTEPAAESAPGSPAPAAGAPQQVVVSVVGLVTRPGLVRLPDSARVADAIDRAGGARPGADLLSLNMAQLLRDGDQILVGRGGEGTVRSAVVSTAGAPAPGARPADGGAAGSGGGLVDLNTATAEQLDALPGVGPVTAAAILAWREAHGRFSSVDQLAEIDGIGPARLAKLKPLVSAG